jgi:hypothetical protein
MEKFRNALSVCRAFHSPQLTIAFATHFPLIAAGVVSIMAAFGTGVDLFDSRGLILLSQQHK